jgi:hypothetical protein
MDYMVNRWYDPAVGEFVSVDPLVATTEQAYEYANGDPNIYIDPLGLSIWSTIAPFAGVVLGAVSDTIDVVSIVADSTGAGTIVGVPLGFVGGLAGAGAVAIDAKSCYSGNKVSCVGAGLGTLGALGGFLPEGEAPFALLVAPSLAGSGIAGTLLDAVNAFVTDFAGSSTAPC